MQPTIQAATAKLKQHPEYKRLKRLHGDQVKPIFSFDSAKHHTSSKLQDFLPASFDGTCKFPLPAYSPDIHRVIEHSHARAQAAFEKWLYSYNVPGLTVDDYMREYERIYREQCNVEVIAADVAGLPELFDNIINNNGGWADAEFR